MILFKSLKVFFMQIVFEINFENVGNDYFRALTTLRIREKSRNVGIALELSKSNWPFLLSFVTRGEVLAPMPTTVKRAWSSLSVFCSMHLSVHRYEWVGCSEQVSGPPSRGWDLQLTVQMVGGLLSYLLHLSE